MNLWHIRYCLKNEFCIDRKGALGALPDPELMNSLLSIKKKL